MKKITKSVLGLALIALSCFSSCKKDLTDEEILKGKIEDIIPQQYLDTLEILGLTINSGTTPPNVEGIYFISQTILKASNIPGDFAPGHQFADGRLKVINQSSDFTVDLFGKNFLSTNDTSILTAISGSGNNFTIYGKVKAVSGSNSAIFGIIISGEKDGVNINDLSYGLINIDDTNGGGVFIQEGQARLVFDNDFVSTPLDVLRISNVEQSKNTVTTPLFMKQ